ncbi:MAG: ABC transporter ATP-binding protein/permease [Clostridiales bacterium]|jgi:ATP-binding cassette subfamily B protein|nr:ABC transporter ATP-binding protein/permease [Clostridiales bacterium]
MIKLFLRLRPIDWVFAIILLGFVVLQVYFDVTLPDYVNKMLEPTKIPSNSDSWENGWKMLLLILGSMTSTIIASYFAAIIATQYGKRLRADVFAKVQTFGFAEINKFSTASLITRSSNDIAQVQMAFITLLRTGVAAPLSAIWAIVKISEVDTQLMLYGGLWILLLIVGLACIIGMFIPKFIKTQKMTDKLNSVARENLTGLRVVKAYNAANYQEDKLNTVAKDVQSLDLFMNRLSAFIWPFMVVIMNGMQLTIYWLGGKLVGDSILGYGSFNAGAIIKTVMLAMQVLFAFMGVVFLFVMIPRAIVSSKRINEVLDTTPSVSDPSHPKSFIKSGDIEFKNVSFKYPGAEECVIKDISFKASAGQTVAIIGSTGSGKSTIVNLLPRFYDATSGEVLVGGVNVKDIKQGDLLSSIGYVPQKSLLFSGTVHQNISYGLDRQDDQAVQQASIVASAHEFVTKMDNGYQTHIAQGGKNVSGGQKQRLSIARAVAITPEIFIFDDSFSALDFKTDRAVRDALKQSASNATSLVVAQRVGSIMEADLILVLDQGEVVGKGTHSELIKSCDVYREIAFSQLTAEELGV